MDVEQVLQRAREFLSSRQRAYRRIFLGESPIDGAMVLADLAKFCRAHTSTAHEDPTMAARFDGRREVWLRIQHHLQLSDEDIWKLYNQGGR